VGSIFTSFFGLHNILRRPLHFSAGNKEMKMFPKSLYEGGASRVRLQEGVALKEEAEFSMAV
jgi:hypothetical protein